MKLIQKLLILSMACVSVYATDQLPGNSDLSSRPQIMPCLQRAMHFLEDHKGNVAISHHCVIPHFQHSQVAACCSRIRDTQTLEPLFELWGRMHDFEFFDDPLILPEFIRFIIVLYKTNLDRQVVSKVDTMDQMFDLYNQIANLPIPQLLNLLDDIVNQYEHLSTQYELNNQSLSWSAWLHKYWWAPPIFMLSIFITYLKHAHWVPPQG